MDNCKWEYRIIKRRIFPEGEEFVLARVYVDDNDNSMWDGYYQIIPIGFETIKELKNEIENCQSALDKLVLDLVNDEIKIMR